MSTYFSIIPSGIMSHESLSDGAKITYALVLGLSNQYGYCFATNTKLSEMRSTSESSLKRYLKELIDTGSIVAEYNHRNDRRLTPIIMTSKQEKTIQGHILRKNGHIDEDTDRALDQIWKKLR